MNLVEDVPAYLLPAATLHIALSIAIEGRRSALANALLLGGYLVGLLAGLQRSSIPSIRSPSLRRIFAPLEIPGPRGGLVLRRHASALFGSGIVYLVLGLRQAGADISRQRQLKFALATVILGVIGGMARILPEEIGGPRWIGVTLVAVAVVLATYAILAQHVFVAVDVAGRAVRGSLFAGLGIVAYVALLVGLETTAGRVLAIDIPVVTALAVVVTLSLFEPATEACGIPGRFTACGGRETPVAGAGSDQVLAQAPEPASTALASWCGSSTLRAPCEGRRTADPSPARHRR